MLTHGETPTADGRTKRPEGKRGALVGSGGSNRRRLQSKGPIPKAEDRVYHPTYRRKLAAEAACRGQARLEKVDHLRPELNLAPGHELIARRNAVPEAVRSGIPLSHVFVPEGVASNERLGKVVRMATALDAPLFEAPHMELDRMTDGVIHQGVATEVLPYECTDVEDLVRRIGKGAHAGRLELVVMLDSVVDPHNLDAVMCSANAFGVDDVVTPERHSADVSAAVWKISTEAAARIPAARVPNLIVALGKLRTHGHFAVGLDGCGDAAIENTSFVDTFIMLVAGSEGKGLARLTREMYDAIASTPIAAKLESLNVVVITGIALYQINHPRARSQ